jgi:hypothetical protein
MKSIDRRIRCLESKVSDQAQGILFILSRAGCESEVAESDIDALQEGGYLRRGGINLIRLDKNGEIESISDSARQYLATRRKERGRRWSGA